MRLYTVWILVYPALLLSEWVLYYYYYYYLLFRSIKPWTMIARLYTMYGIHSLLTFGMREIRYLFIVIIWTWIKPKSVAAKFRMESAHMVWHGMACILRWFIFSSYKYWWHDADGIHIYIAHAKSNPKVVWHKSDDTNMFVCVCVCQPYNAASLI